MLTFGSIFIKKFTQLNFILHQLLKNNYVFRKRKNFGKCKKIEINEVKM